MLEIPGCYRGYFLFLTPLNWKVWVAFLIMWLCYACFLFSMSRINTKAKKKMNNGEKNLYENVNVDNMNGQDFNFIECIRHFSFGSMHYGVEQMPQMMGGKVLQCLWSMFMIIFISIFTANLAAIFSDKCTTRPLESIEEIINSGRKAFAFKGSKETMLQVTNPIVSHMMNTNRIDFDVEFNGFRMEEEMKERLKKGYIWVDLDYYIEKYWEVIDGLYILDGFFTYTGYGFVMRSEWAYTDGVKRKMISYGYSGVFDQLNRKYSPKQIIKTAQEHDEISLGSIAGVLVIIFVAGFVVTLVQITSVLINLKSRHENHAKAHPKIEGSSH